jgi:hypothetical protein
MRAEGGREGGGATRAEGGGRGGRGMMGAAGDDFSPRSEGRPSGEEPQLGSCPKWRALKDFSL